LSEVTEGVSLCCWRRREKEWNWMGF